MHIAVDTLGLPHALHVSRANATDRNGAIERIALNLDTLSSISKFLVDGGYTGEKFAGQVMGLLPNAEVEVVKRSELHNFKVLPKR